MAEKAELSRVHISCIERGERVPSLAAVINIANALNVTVDELVSDNLFFSEVLSHRLLFAPRRMEDTNSRYHVLSDDKVHINAPYSTLFRTFYWYLMLPNTR